MKIYAMVLRSSWYPVAFVDECIGENVAKRQLKSPAQNRRRYGVLSRNEEIFSSNSRRFSSIVERFVGRRSDDIVLL